MPDYLAAAGGILLLAPSVYVASLLDDPDVRYGLASRAAIGFGAFCITSWLVPTLAVYTQRKGLFGRDLGKRYMPELQDVPVPEALGLVPAVAFLVAVIGCQVLYAAGDNPVDQARYNSSLCSVCFMVLLGFMDDVLDLPWRAKLVLPTVASLPLLVTYAGSTSIVVPRPLRAWLVQASSQSSSGGVLTSLGYCIDLIPWVTVDSQGHGAILELGVLYLVYMGALSVFCTNAINIYAGINGLEAGQAYVIGCFMLLYAVLQVYFGSADTPQYMFAATLTLPFLGATLGLLRHNWYPSKVFVGDTFCYFAGMAFAVVGIHGHFTKPLLLFFLPQVANFVYSVPQLFKFVPCPRHRLPVPLEPIKSTASAAANAAASANDSTIRSPVPLMVPSTFPSKPGQHGFWKQLHGLPLSADALPNFTVLNLMLRILGPTSERGLCVALLVLQAASCAAALTLRFSPFASYLFDG